MLRLVNPAATHETIFSENFIQDQLRLIKEASQAVTQAGLLEEKKINAIINYMKNLRADTHNYTVAGDKGRKSYRGLLSLIENTIQRLDTQYKWSGTHPLVPALQQINKNIEKHIQASQPQFYSVISQERKNESTNTRAEGETDEIDEKPISLGANKERVFSENFIQQQSSIIEEASGTITQDGLLEEKKMRSLVEYMQDLHVTTQQITMIGATESRRNYTGLLELIDDITDELKSNYHWKKVHPLIPALEVIKKNIQQYIISTQPQFAQHLKLDQQQNITTVASARWEMVKDACGILGCFIWFVPEKILTLDNGCQALCGPSEGICPGPSLPKQTKNGKTMYWSLWSPGESIVALCKDMGDHALDIDDLHAAPIRHSMN